MPADSRSQQPRPLALVDEGLGNSSYLLDAGDGRALVIDPGRDPARYLDAAERQGLVIAYAAETHLHADFVSGSRELAARGARVIASGASGLEFPHRGLGDGDEVDLGGLTLRALATPGHTPEHLAYLLLDGTRPVGLFSGGSLLVGAVARTDLIAPDQTDALARSLWRSLREQVLTLPDDVAVYPTHGAGSLCSAPAGTKRTTTIGREKAANPLLAATSEDAFVLALLRGLGTYPSYFSRLREVNRRGPAVYGPEPPSLPALAADEVRGLVVGGARVIDARPVTTFAAGHISGALSIPLRDAFATWLGWLADPGQPLVFVFDDAQDRAELVRQALKIGYEHLAGELAGGMAAWTGPTRSIALIPAGQISGPVLDIRQDAEYAAGHIPGAAHVELGALTDDGTRIGPGPLTLICGHGERAMTAASLLAAAGRGDLTVAVGGPDDWAAATGRRLHARR
jgi:hydroxyacylglutathione hydrolase